MPTVNIDNTEYDLDSLPDEAKKAFSMLRITDQEIQRLQAQIAIFQAARLVYSKALKDNLPPPAGDTISFAGVS